MPSVVKKGKIMYSIRYLYSVQEAFCSHKFWLKLYSTYPDHILNIVQYLPCILNIVQYLPGTGILNKMKNSI